MLDCLPNLVNRDDYPLDTVYARILNAVRGLRQKHPATPILLAEHAGYTDKAINWQNYQSFNCGRLPKKNPLAQI